MAENTPATVAPALDDKIGVGLVNEAIDRVLAQVPADIAFLTLRAFVQVATEKLGRGFGQQAVEDMAGQVSRFVEISAEKGTFLPVVTPAGALADHSVRHAIWCPSAKGEPCTCGAITRN